MTEELQNKLHAEVDRYKSIQKEYHKLLAQRQQLDGQLNENTAVKQELDLLKSDAQVYKLIGPILMKQDLDEARQNVEKRIGFIRSELRRIDDLVAGVDKKQDAQRESIAKLQQQFQQIQMMGAAKP